MPWGAGQVDSGVIAGTRTSDGRRVMADRDTAFGRGPDPARACWVCPTIVMAGAVGLRLKAHGKLRRLKSRQGRASWNR